MLTGWLYHRPKYKISNPSFTFKKELSIGLLLIFICFLNENERPTQAELLHFNLLIYSTRLRSWFMHCATSRKVAGSIPGGVIEVFH